MKHYKITDLVPNPSNPRTITDAKFKQLVKSIKAFPEMLEARPIVCTPEMIILGGNMRYRAAQEAGLKKVPAIIQDWTEEQKDQFIIKDNIGYGEWDWDLLANQWNENELLDWGLDVWTPEEEPLVAEDDNYTIPDNIETLIKEGDIIEIGRHKLMCGDSCKAETWSQLMQDEVCDLVLTDPPYNVDYQGGTGLKIANDKMSDNAYVTFLTDHLTHQVNHTKEGGAFYVWHADSNGLPTRQAFEDAGILMKQCLVWIKDRFVLGRQDYQWQHEPCLYGWKPGAAHYFINDRKNTTVIEPETDIEKLNKKELLEIVREVYSGPTTAIKCKRPHKNAEHPTMKPIEIMADMIRNSSLPGDLVCDGFLGSGSTMVAAHQLGRTCYGFELMPKYAEVIIDRMTRLEPTIQIKINGKHYEPLLKD